MKAQCVHSDTGLCKTCFEYEVEIAALKNQLQQGKEEVYKYQEDAAHREMDNFTLKKQLQEGKDLYKHDMDWWKTKFETDGETIKDLKKQLQSKYMSVEEVEKILTYYGIAGRPAIAQALTRLPKGNK